MFEYLQVHGGEHDGMIRWSEAAWETCFQDDVARAILPLLLVQFLGKKYHILIIYKKRLIISLIQRVQTVYVRLVRRYGIFTKVLLKN